MCGVAGGAVAFWLRLIDCGRGGIITTRIRDSGFRSGFFIVAGFNMFCFDQQGIRLLLFI